MRITIAMMCLILALKVGAQTTDTLTVMTYNCLFFPSNGNSDPLGSDDARKVHFKNVINEVDPDIILLQEISDASGATILVDELNANATTGKIYAHSPLADFEEYGPNPFQIGNMLIYNTEVVGFNSQVEVPRNNSAVEPDGGITITPRASTQYDLSIVSKDCPNESNSLKAYSSHLKAGFDNANSSEIADRDRRVLGAQDLMDHINALSISDNVIAVGDFNFYSDNTVTGTYAEPAYDVLIDAGNANPLIDYFGGFTRNISDPVEVAKYTQSTRQVGFNEYGNGGSNGGLDDRFDFIWYNNAINDNSSNIQLIPGTYKTPGSPLGWNNDALDGNSPIASDLHFMSDHYPVVLDIESFYANCSLCQADVTETINYPAGSTIMSEAEFSISASNVIEAGASVTYSAGLYIELNAGFEVETNGEFETLQTGCN